MKSTEYQHPTAATRQRAVPRINPWLQLAMLFGLFIAGGLVGLTLSSWAAPDSGLAAGVSAMLLPAAFAVGLLTWSGLDILFAVIDLIRGRERRRQTDLSLRTGAWFVPIAVALSCGVGFVVGVIPGGQGVIVSMITYCATGVAYGFVVSRLAARGFLPAPHSS